MTEGDKLYMLSAGGFIQYVCPVFFVRETKAQIIVKTPKGREVRFFTEGYIGVGNPDLMLRDHVNDLKISDRGRLQWSKESMGQR